MNMRMNVASPGILSTPPCSHLGLHFLELAEEARANGNEKLAFHLTGLALKEFDKVFGQGIGLDPKLSDTSGTSCLPSFRFDDGNGRGFRDGSGRIA